MIVVSELEQACLKAGRAMAARMEAEHTAMFDDKKTAAELEQELAAAKSREYGAAVLLRCVLDKLRENET